MIKTRSDSSRLKTMISLLTTVVLAAMLTLSLSGQDQSTSDQKDPSENASNASEKVGGAPEDSVPTGIYGPDHLWRGWFGFQGKYGTDRNLHESELFVPVTQDDRSLIFADVRGRVDDDSDSEISLGGGYRQMMDRFNLGLYGFFDMRETKFDNNFEQVTLGAEVLTEKYDARLNGYIPVGDRQETVPAASEVQLTGNSISVVPGEETALHGADLEVGRRLPITKMQSPFESRVYLGGFWFDQSDVDAITGGNARAQVRYYDVLGMGSDTFASLNYEFRTDNERGSENFVGFRFQIPFGGRDEEKVESHDRPYLVRRMVEPVERDEDVQTSVGATASPEDAVNVRTGVEIDNVDQDVNNLSQAISSAGQNDLIILNEDGSFYGGVTLKAVKRWPAEAQRWWSRERTPVFVCRSTYRAVSRRWTAV